MRRFCRIAATSAFLSIAGAQIAWADDCSGHDHDTGTALGAVGGAAIGGLASHSIVGALVGGVVGGVAGNAIARSDDCAKAERRADAEAERRADADAAYNQGYADRAAEDHAVAEDRVAAGAPRSLHDDVDVNDRPDRDDYPR